jgi:Na+-transporting methylmalonyl-CoA/oxaloacetate decarboxylase beta subunit
LKTKAVTTLTVIAAIITVISAAYKFLLPMVLSLVLNFDTKDAASVGIIGGADGPTAIYITGRLTGGVPRYLITVVFASVTVAGIIYRNHLLKGGK